GRGQHGSSLVAGKVIVLQRKQDIFPHRVFIGMIQDLPRRLRQQPVLELLLLGKHLLVEGCVQFFVGHRASASFSWVLGLVTEGLLVAAAFSSANTEGRVLLAITCSGWGCPLPSRFRAVSSSTRRADLTRRSSSYGKVFPASSFAAACC